MGKQDEQSSYRRIMKGTTIFGGVQIFNILINLIRNKFVAVLLGPVGMGISSLFVSTLLVFQQFSVLGINVSAVKDISKAHESNNKHSLSLTIRICRRILKITAAIGCLLLICFSPLISELVFGDRNYTWAFIFLSIALFFNILKDGETAILQGSKRLKNLAFSSLVGPIVGLFLGVPLYYVFGLKGIVPSIIILAIFSYAFVYHFSKKIDVEKHKITKEEGQPIAKEMISLGVVSMMAVILGSLSYFILNIFISNLGTVADVGLYQASIALTSQSVGLVFSAMSVDYYPRLAAVSEDNVKVKEMVNQQSEIILLIIAPIIIFLIFASPFLIRLLLSKEYMVIIPVVRWIAFGLLFKAMYFPMGYIAFSKGDKKFYFWFDGFSSNLMMLLLGAVGYWIGGIIGIGVAFCILYLLYFFLYIIATRRRYQFRHDKVLVKLIFKISPLVFMTFIVSLFNMEIYSYIIILLCLTLSVIISYKELNKRIDIKQLLRRKL